MNGVALIAAERKRQIEAERWSDKHDDTHDHREMAVAASCYILHAVNGASKPPRIWPWDRMWWKPSNNQIRNLVKAGALIAAEIDRLQRRGL